MLKELPADKVARNFGYVDATSNSNLPVAIASSAAVVATGGTVAEPEPSRLAGCDGCAHN